MLATGILQVDTPGCRREGLFQVGAPGLFKPSSTCHKMSSVSGALLSSVCGLVALGAGECRRYSLLVSVDALPQVLSVCLRLGVGVGGGSNGRQSRT